MGNRVQSPRGTGTVGFAFGACRAKGLPGPILTELLGRLGQTPNASRQLLARLLAAGLLRRERRGRVSVYRLAEAVLAEFDTIRVGGAAPSWEGHFHLVVYDLPEQDRLWRDRLRSAAFGAGFASWRSGVLIGSAPPDTWLAPYLRDARRLGLVETGTWTVDPTAARRVAARAWDLERHRGPVGRACDQVRELRAPARVVDAVATADGWDELRRLHDTFAVAATVWLSVPNLPSQLLPADWPMGELAAAVAGVATQTAGVITATLDPWLDDHPYASLLDRYTPQQSSAGQSSLVQALQRSPD